MLKHVTGSGEESVEWEWDMLSLTYLKTISLFYVPPHLRGQVLGIPFPSSHDWFWMGLCLIYGQ